MSGRVGDFFQQAYGLVEHCIGIVPIAIGHSPCCMIPECLKNYHFRNIGYGIQAIERIIRHIFKFKLNSSVLPSNVDWDEITLLRLRCELVAAQTNIPFYKTKPLQIGDIHPALEENLEDHRKLDIYNYAHLLLTHHNLPLPLYAGGSLLNQVGGKTPDNALFMLDGARRLVATALTHAIHVDVHLIITKRSYNRLILTSCTNQPQRFAENGVYGWDPKSS